MARAMENLLYLTAECGGAVETTATVEGEDAVVTTGASEGENAVETTDAAEGEDGGAEVHVNVEDGAGRRHL